MGFLDGHAGFILTGKPILEAYMGGHYPPGLTNEGPIFSRWGLVRTGTGYAWR